MRIHHKDKRDCVVQIPHMGRMTAHGPKLYNITLDGAGDAIVSKGVLDRLTEACGLLGYSPFVVLNEVVDPPPLFIGDVQGRVRQRFQLVDGELVEVH